MFPRLLGDVGGTHVRLAWQAQAGAALTHALSLPSQNFAGLQEALQAYLQQQGLPPPQAACLGMANPVLDDQVRMTNRDWSFSRRALAERLGLGHLTLINDFTALALALPGLLLEEQVQVGGRASGGSMLQPLALLGPGTGLGMGGLLPDRAGRWLALAGEGGHSTLAARNELEWRLLERLRQRHGHVSAERVLSGQGLSALYAVLCEEQGARPEVLPAARISEMALRDRSERAMECLGLFCGFLGSVAGDLALTLGARGGVYLGGGMVPRWLGWFERSGFRASFEAKGRFAAYLQDIPVWVIQARESPALRGAALALAQELDGA